MKYVVFILVCMSVLGCSSLDQITSKDSLQKDKIAEEKSLKTARESLAHGQFEESYKLYREFQLQYPQSIFIQAARLGEASSLQGQKKWVLAVEIEKDVFEKTRDLQLDIAALALYQLSFSYEALGDDQKTIATLLDAKMLSSSLPKEVALAEIPARLAGAYGRVNQESEAIRYIADAEKGLAKLQSEDSLLMSKDWLAKTYVQMGTSYYNQLSKENFETSVNSQKLTQVYLFKALAIDDPIWSKKAYESLKTSYEEFYIQVIGVSEKANEVQLLGGLFVGLVERAELYKPLTGQTQNSYQIDLFTMLSDMKSKTEKLLYQGRETTNLTEESKKLNSIKRVGKSQVELLLPEEKKADASSSGKTVPTEDPNL